MSERESGKTTSIDVMNETATLVDHAWHRLRVDIISGDRVPGERLRIERLKALYDIGPSPLREALQRLCSEGLVIAQGRRGFSVAPLDFDDFADLNVARTVVEVGALRRSIALGDRGWEAGIVAARYVMAREDEALSAGADHVPDSWEQANAAFHTSLVAACDSQWLLKTRTSLHDLCERYRRAAVHRRIGSRDLDAEHHAIAEAALNRDPDLAAELIENHFAATASSLVRQADSATLSSID